MNPQDRPRDRLAQSIDEKELAGWMREAQAGDADSYRRLLERLQKMLGQYVHNSFQRFGMAADRGQDDVVQETLLAIHQKRHTYDPSQYFLPWMYAITRYKMIDYLRKNKIRLRSTVSIDDELETSESLMSLESFDEKAEHDIEALLATLPPKQRQVLALVKIQGLSIDEAAKQTGYSASDIKVSVHRAIRNLQDSVKGSAFNKDHRG